MANFKEIIDQQLANAFNNVLAPGGLTKDIVIHFFVSDGEYDPVTETTQVVTDDVPVKNIVVAKPEFKDVKDRGVSFSDSKLLIPGSFIPREPNTDTDMVTLGGRKWNIRACKGVPGEGIYIIFVNL